MTSLPVAYTVTSRHEFRGNSWSATLKFASWTYDASLLDLQPLPGIPRPLPGISQRHRGPPPAVAVHIHRSSISKVAYWDSPSSPVPAVSMKGRLGEMSMVFPAFQDIVKDLKPGPRGDSPTSIRTSSSCEREV